MKSGFQFAPVYGDRVTIQVLLASVFTLVGLLSLEMMNKKWLRSQHKTRNFNCSRVEKSIYIPIKEVFLQITSKLDWLTRLLSASLRVG
jgi:hypothetical protein